MKVTLIMDIERHDIGFRLESETEDRVLTINLMPAASKAIHQEMLEWLWSRFPSFLEHQGKPRAENTIQCIGYIRPEDCGAVSDGSFGKQKQNEEK